MISLCLYDNFCYIKKSMVTILSLNANFELVEKKVNIIKDTITKYFLNFRHLK